MGIGVAGSREVDVVVAVFADGPVGKGAEEVLAQHEVVVDAQVARPRCHLSGALEVASLACEVVLKLEAGVVGGEELVGACHAACVGELLGDAQVAQHHVFEIEAGGHVEAVVEVLDSQGGIVQRIGDDGTLSAHGIVVEHFLLVSVGIFGDVIGIQARVLRERAVGRVAAVRLIEAYVGSHDELLLHVAHVEVDSLGVVCRLLHDTGLHGCIDVEAVAEHLGTARYAGRVAVLEGCAQGFREPVGVDSAQHVAAIPVV